MTFLPFSSHRQLCRRREKIKKSPTKVQRLGFRLRAAHLPALELDADAL